jgi:hypothetical protein
MRRDALYRSPSEPDRLVPLYRDAVLADLDADTAPTLLVIQVANDDDACSEQADH